MSNEAPIIAVVDDDPAQRGLLENALTRAGYPCLLCENGEQAIAAAGDCSLMLLDVRMPGMSGMEVLEQVRASHPALPVILLTAYIDVRDAVAAIKQGATDYLEKPIDLDELIAVIEDTIGVTPKPGNEAPLALPEGVIVESNAARQIFRQAAQAAPSGATVLILGESGTGKEVVARFIHAASARAAKAWIAVDCASLPAPLVESELFGHEAGAFTGAAGARDGCFAAAHDGTLFLDEIGELPLSLQPKLLRTIETGTYRRVGGNEERRADVRIIAATNRNLEEEAREGRFREDLFFRLNVFPLVMPPLRERAEDILPMAEAFLQPARKRLAPAAQRLLLDYDWPGNVRELRNAMERAAIVAAGGLVLPADLPPAVQRAHTTEKQSGVLVGDMQEIQRRAIMEALEKTGGNKTHAAEMLGISRRNLIYKLRAYGM